MRDWEKIYVKTKDECPEYFTNILLINRIRKRQLAKQKISKDYKQEVNERGNKSVQ